MRITSSEYAEMIRKNPKLKPIEEVKISTPNTHNSVIEKIHYIKFTIPGQPVGKPRQTQSDKWKKRPCVMRYRAWADLARASIFNNQDLRQMREISFVAYMELPASYSKKKKQSLMGTPHHQKPDIDNICKSVLDALLPEDKNIWKISAEKRWDDGNRPRMEVELR